MIYRKMRLSDFDKTLMAMVLLLFGLGLVFLMSATSLRSQEMNLGYVMRQMTSFFVAVAIMFIIINIDYQRLIDASWVIYGVNILALVLLMFIGRARLGAQRWFAIGNFTIQPSEFIKVTFILTLASYISGKRYMMNRLENLIGPFLIFAAPFILVLLQPDLGTALLLAPMLFIMLYAGGANLRHLLSIGGLGLACAPLFWNFLRDYQR